MAKAKAKKKSAKSLLVPTDRFEVSKLLGTAVSGSAKIPAVGVTYQLDWEVRGGEMFASIRVVSVNRKSNGKGFVGRNF